MEGVDDAARDGVDGVFHIAGFVQGVGVDGNLNVHVVGDAQGGADHGGHGTPVLMHLEAARAGLDLFDQRNAVVGVPLAEDAHVHRHGVDGFEHFADIPRAGGNGRSVGAVGGADAAAEEGGHAVGERGVTLLRGDVVNVRVDAAGGEDEMLAGDGVGGIAHDKIRIDTIHHRRVAALADAHDPAVPDAHVGFDDALHRVDDGDVGDDKIKHASIAVQAGIAAHAAAQGFTAAVHGLVAVVAQVLFDFDKQIRVPKPDFVPNGRAEEGSVFLTRNCRHMKLLSAASVARGLLFGVLEAELVGTFFVDDPFVFVPGPAVHEVVEPVGAGSPADGDEGYSFFIARLETDGGRGGDVQTHSVSCVAIEFEGAVHFEEMKMGADLNGAVAGVTDFEGDGFASRIEFNGIGTKDQPADRRFGLVRSLVGHGKIPL